MAKAKADREIMFIELPVRNRYKKAIMREDGMVRAIMRLDRISRRKIRVIKTTKIPEINMVSLRFDMLAFMKVEPSF
jgi:hypothetical protein